MPNPLSEHTTRRLHMIFDRGAENASLALSKWVNQNVTLQIGAVESVGITEAVNAIGPGESLVAACAMEILGPLNGQLILIFDDRAGLALVDLLLRQPVGTSTTWGELEQSAAKETANIVGCAYLNALASHLPGEAEPLIPAPPSFRHEFAASLLEFALLDQAMQSDEVLLIHTRFQANANSLDWSLLFVPSGASLVTLSRLFSH